MTTFRLSLQFNESYAFREASVLTEFQQLQQALVPDVSGASRPGIRRCRNCNHILAKWEEPLTGLVIKKPKLDLSITYDGILVVSEKFKLTYERGNLTGLVIHVLPDDHQFYSVRARRAVLFDSEIRGTRFIKPCDVCGHFESVVGATPIYLKSGSDVGDREFVRTDVEFGTGDSQSPLLLCGKQAADCLKAADLKGVDCFPIEQEA